MVLRGDLRKQNISFAIESYPFNESFSQDKEFCLQNSDENLKGLIKWCISRIVLRKLTEQEKNQLHAFKEEQKSGLLFEIFKRFLNLNH